MMSNPKNLCRSRMPRLHADRAPGSSHSLRVALPRSPRWTPRPRRPPANVPRACLWPGPPCCAPDLQIEAGSRLFKAASLVRRARLRLAISRALPPAPLEPPVPSFTSALSCDRATAPVPPIEPTKARATTHYSSPPRPSPEFHLQRLPPLGAAEPFSPEFSPTPPPPPIASR